jgi:hypothetical protein
MSKDINLLGKALKRIAILLLLFIAAPVLLTMAFKAIKLYTEGYQYWLSIIFLIIAGALILFTIYFAIKTFSAISKAIFKN